MRFERAEEKKKKISDLILNVIVEEANHWKECQRKSQQNFFLFPSSAALNPIRSSMRVISRGRHAAAGRFWVILDALGEQDDADGWLVGKVQALSVSSEVSFAQVRLSGERRRASSLILKLRSGDYLTVLLDWFLRWYQLSGASHLPPLRLVLF